ncbi:MULTISPECIES: helix-turn-helix domain-containing protein [unclassified Enterococcus]|uniref:helix-turn-helix domain-containing protein n=1 Tax=unclassified Enterococcus TaxID=2608891 RepID=UPI001552FAC0|nr:MULTISPECIES: helix-turn-helix domain-containing protein [unclassified Enterococcus]MBS7578141.1 helix-turn-helix domain-containing protein [Enterococcus sp. MMGLQ5-2]MBS7584043.1 helix-turn-helix domain-containing protein [Enterococcus sp. MMGLQ5-1]NPD11904.1 helix-turn-helix domain-containing protein [Enterococcus sp. MMGLQ5-1]NPD37972.1 helix-turn-helix domain-containing protein [Enterococcus sp. MMGLQ5-2]
MRQNIKIGKLISQARKQKRLTQKELCLNLCSQSMLSAIENNQYRPNAELFIALCRRLSLDLNQIALKYHYPISKINEFNQSVADLCNAHHYEALYNFLISESVISQLETRNEYRNYYYYLGCATFHVKRDLQETEQLLKLALAEDKMNDSSESLALLAYASLGFIYALKRQLRDSQKLFEYAITQIKSRPFDENLAVIFYLKTLAQIILNENRASINGTISEGIDLVTKHHAVHMLANLYYLSSIVNKGDKGNDDLLRSEIFKDLYGEVINTKISEY